MRGETRRCFSRAEDARHVASVGIGEQIHRVKVVNHRQDGIVRRGPDRDRDDPVVRRGHGHECRRLVDGFGIATQPTADPKDEVVLGLAGAEEGAGRREEGFDIVEAPEGQRHGGIMADTGKRSCSWQTSCVGVCRSSK